MRDDVLEAWGANNRINLLLIDRISDEGMACTLSKRGGRDVSRQFAHMHNIRLAHLGERAPDLASDLVKFEGRHHPDKAELRTAFAAWDRSERTFEDAGSGFALFDVRAPKAHQVGIEAIGVLPVLSDPLVERGKAELHGNPLGGEPDHVTIRQIAREPRIAGRVLCEHEYLVCGQEQ